MSVNRVIILGNLGRDPEVRYTQGGQAVATLSVATSRKWKDKSGAMQDEVEWHRVTVWGKQAESCEKYLSKGRQVYIEGRLKTSSYEKDGAKRYQTEIVAEQVTFIGGGKGEGEARDGDRPGFARAPEPYDPGDGYGSRAANGGAPDVDDIPF